MPASFLQKSLVAAVVLAAGVAVLGWAPSSIGQEAKKTDKAEKKAKGRLPAYYSDIVTEEQRLKIYEIQARHQEKLSELNAQLLAATKAMTAEIESVLTAEQKAKLKTAQEEGAAKKKKSAAEKKAAEPKATAEPAPAKSTAKPKAP